MIHNLMIPQPHQHFVDQAISLMPDYATVVGLAAGGSWITASMDEYSDLDLLVVYKSSGLPWSLPERQQFASSLGNLIASFTGEHVGEPRLLICLYDDPLLHVDLKFVDITDFHKRVEDPVILWQRSTVLSDELKKSIAQFPYPDWQWIEDRFWIWIHYATLKMGRGEWFEVIDFISFIRSIVLGPLLLLKNGHLPRGVRRVETALENDDLERLYQTIATSEPLSCITSLEEVISCYQYLRATTAPKGLKPNQQAEEKVLAYFFKVAQPIRNKSI